MPLQRYQSQLVCQSGPEEHTHYRHTLESMPLETSPSEYRDRGRCFRKGTVTIDGDGDGGRRDSMRHRSVSGDAPQCSACARQTSVSSPRRFPMLLGLAQRGPKQRVLDSTRFSLRPPVRQAVAACIDKLFRSRSSGHVWPTSLVSPRRVEPTTQATVKTQLLCILGSHPCCHGEHMETAASAVRLTCAGLAARLRC